MSTDVSRALSGGTAVVVRMALAPAKAWTDSPATRALVNMDRHDEVIDMTAPRPQSSSTGAIRLPPAPSRGSSRPYTPSDMGISRPVSNASMRRPKPNPALPPAYSDGRDVDAVLNKMVMAAQAYDAGPGDMRSKQQLLPSMSQPELVPISAISPYDESARLRREVVRVRRL